jgi:OPA family glycerol-3-phosphate transporter-like MFS transporter
MATPMAAGPATSDPRVLWRWQVQTFALLWTAYASYYLCRMNFAVAQPLILAEFPDWSAAQVGWIPSVYAAVYAVGQFVNGQLGEKLGARRMMTVAMALAALSNLAFSMTSSYTMMLVLWGINGYAQSAGWALVVKTLTNWTPSKRRGLLVGLISTSYQVGNVIAWLLAGVLAEQYGWRTAFWLPSILLAVMGIIFAIGLRNSPQDAGLPPVRDDLGNGTTTDSNGVVVDNDRPLSAAEVLRLTFANRILWVLGLGYFCANSVRYAFMNWAVTYMNDVHGQSIKGSAFTAVALPLIGAVGAVSAGWFSDRLFGGRRAPVCAISLYFLAAVCLGFIFIPKGQWMVATAMLGLAGFLIYGPDMLMSGAATADVHPRATAAATGFTMSLGAAGSILSGAGVGYLKDISPNLVLSLQSIAPPSIGPLLGEWTVIFLVLAGLSMVPATLMVTIWNARPKGA